MAGKRNAQDETQDVLFKRPRLGKRESSSGKRSDGNEPSSFEAELLGMEGVELATDWSRPRAPRLDPRSMPLVFQQVEVDNLTRRQPFPGMPGPQEGQTPEIRMFGGTDGGNSVLCHVHGFTPYFYFPAPDWFQPAHARSFLQQLNDAVKSRLSTKAPRQGQAVLAVEVERKSSIYGFNADDRDGKGKLILKITVSEHRYISTCKNVVRDGFDVRCGGKSISFQADAFFESNIEYNLRFMVDTGVVGCNWIELPAGSYSVRSEDKKESYCQYEVDVAFDKFISHAPEKSETEEGPDWLRVAPFRILSFDIECAGRKGIFPEPEHDPVIQIANMVQRQGETKPFIRNVFVLGTCAHIVGSEVVSCKTEKELLSKWTKFVQQVDPDFVTGYNICNFDLTYLMERAKKLKVKDFPYLGRMKMKQSELKEQRFSSKAYGNSETKLTTMDGRLQFDVLQVLKRDYKLRKYSLNSVASHFLNEQKEDVDHSIITDLHKGNEQTRRRLAVYCMKDAYLPLRLLDKLMSMFNYMEMARVTGVPFSYLLSRGQQIKVISQLLRRCKTLNLLIPVNETKGSSDEQYEGAIVIQPDVGYYQSPIATLDFSSLYPSIMQAHNLCYTTLLRTADLQKLKSSEYIKTPNGFYFVKASTRKGVLPEILKDLLAARKRAKADLKKETDPFKRAVLDGRQRALKVSANSVYGFTGATIGRLPCLEISSSVTAFGRDMIEATKKYVQERYTVANGYEYDAKVIYGDTDSVMIKFGEYGLDPETKTADLTMIMERAKEAAKYITSKFVNPINLEFEKVYYPYLLMNKKRYAGLYWTNPNHYDKMDAKGIVTVRRDNCPLVVTLIKTCLHKLLIERDRDGAVGYAKQTISDLLCNRVDISQLVITKALSKSREEYDAKQAHVELAERMRKRDAGSAPAMGDRVAYVITETKGALYDKSEDPIYVLEHNIPLDTKYYLERQLANPLKSIFEPVVGAQQAESLLKGDHTRTIVKKVRSDSGLMKFAKKSATCVGCKALLRKNETALCSSCVERESEIYQKEVSKLMVREQKFARLWSQCQRCQSSVLQDVICSSKDCPIFYMRKKAQKDVSEQEKVLSRFDVNQDCGW